MATAKKPSAAQIRARKLFAKRAKSGEFRKNPAKRAKSAKPVTRPSQASGKKPSKRLVARRVATKKAPKGFFANPKKRVTRYAVRLASADRMGEDRIASILNAVATFDKKSDAVQYAQALADLHGKSYMVYSVE